MKVAILVTCIIKKIYGSVSCDLRPDKKTIEYTRVIFLLMNSSMGTRRSMLGRDRIFINIQLSHFCMVGFYHIHDYLPRAEQLFSMTSDYVSNMCKRIKIYTS